MAASERTRSKRHGQPRERLAAFHEWKHTLFNRQLSIHKVSWPVAASLSKKKKQPSSRLALGVVNLRVQTWVVVHLHLTICPVTTAPAVDVGQ